MLNNNIRGAKNGNANQKQQLSDRYMMHVHIIYTDSCLAVIYISIYLCPEDELKIGASAFGSVLSAIALMTGLFFPEFL